MILEFPITQLNMSQYIRGACSKGYYKLQTFVMQPAVFD